MAEASKYLRTWRHEGEGGFVFFCPGCKSPHMIKTEGQGAWGFEGDVNAPTFTPSIRVSDDIGTLCHSFITGGEIQFLTDCRHDLKGKTVPLPELPAHLKD